MKKIYILITLFAVVGAAQSQTIISNHYPSPGDVFKYFNTDTLAIVPGSSGTAQVWNFEDLNVNTVLQTDNYLSPVVTTPPATGQTTTLGDSVNGYFFYKNTPTEYTMLGLTDTINGGELIYSNPGTLITFPFSFNSVSNDNFAFTTTYLGNTVNATGTITTTGDGTGNLLLPQGAFNNVLRVKFSIVTNISVSIVTIVQTRTIYEWYDGNYKFPLLHIETIHTTDPFGGAPTFVKLVLLEATGPAGIKQLSSISNFNLMPNPAKDMINVKFETVNINQTKIVIVNALGQIVYENNNVDAKLSNLNISTSDLEKGVYFVSVIQYNQSSTKKLVIQ